MGMYTGIRFVGMLKKDYIDDIEELIDSVDSKMDWIKFAEKYPFAKEFSSLPRAQFIPFGAMTYNEDKFGTTFSNIVTGDDGSDPYGYRETLVFQCDFKNYDDEIECFLETVATNLCDKFVAEKWYEENAFPRVYLYDGKDLKIW